MRVGVRLFGNGSGLGDKTAVRMGDGRTLESGSAAKGPSRKTDSLLMQVEELPEGAPYGGSPARGLFAASPAVAAWTA